MHRRARLLAAVAATIFGAAPLTACGGGGEDPKQEYAQQVSDILQPLGQQLNDLGTGLSGSSDPKQIDQAAEEGQSDLDSAIADLEALDPPSDVNQVNGDLVAALSAFNDELGDVQAAAAKNDLGELKKQALQLPQAAADLQGKLTDIQNAAIDAGVPIKETQDSGS